MYTSVGRIDRTANGKVSLASNEFLPLRVEMRSDVAVVTWEQWNMNVNVVAGVA